MNVLDLFSGIGGFAESVLKSKCFIRLAPQNGVSVSATVKRQSSGYGCAMLGAVLSYFPKFMKRECRR